MSDRCRTSRFRTAGINWWRIRLAADDDDMFSLSDGFKSVTFSHVLWSAGGKRGFTPTKQNTRWANQQDSPPHCLVGVETCRSVCQSSVRTSKDAAPNSHPEDGWWLFSPEPLPVEALHLGTLMAAHGYFFPISDHVLTLKDDGTFYRFQTPYFWPSNCWEPENTDYAVYLCKRTMQNKARLELADYEAESLARLQRAFARKWEFIFMQAEAQAKVDKKRDKIERKILDSQERAFWDVHRPVPGCVNTTEVDIKKSSRMKNPHKTRKSVYGLQNDIRTHSPTHTPAPEAKQPTEEELQQQITFWQLQLDRHRLKMSKVAESLVGYTEQYFEYDPFLTPPDPSNPWISDDTTLWELEASKEPGQQRVKRWAFGIDEVLKDPVGREQFLKFLESEFSSENLRFWLAVQELKKRPIREVPTRVQEIWQEFLAPGAPSAINVDSKSYDKTTQNVKDPGRYAFEDAQEHIYKLMKSDSYSRFIRSSAYQELLQAKKKKSKNLF
ncbi:Regulator of G-protein signaling 7 [Oryzias melastigma]|uniref:Regulator of G-protein signaling 7 n=1 Tax=Oryzias melastigma TaxID=30732 RepID=A0A834FLA6_ORYME|nr:Regulator of G-protein signaling 7 [Oryzias melastigma]